MSAKFTIDQVSKHNKQDDCYMVISGKVYDISTFMEEHPGGDEVLLEQAGMDATEAFEEIGHSDDARQLLKPLLLGDFVPGPKTETKDIKKSAVPVAAKSVPVDNSGMMMAMVPMVAILAFLIYKWVL